MTSPTTLHQLPPTGPLFLQAAASLTRRARADVHLPGLEVRVPGVLPDRQQLQAYREICGFSGDQTLPITYPQVLAASLHLWLLTRPAFPLPVIGIVHLRNRIEQTAPLAADRGYEIRVRLGGSRTTHLGLEFDLVTEWRDDAGQVVWHAVTTPLSRIKTGLPKPAREAAPAPPRLVDYRSFEAPEDIGRRYAPIAQDYNPIHLYPLTARLFGFPRAIAHGMWALARATALLEGVRGRDSRSLSVQFRQPLLLPGKVTLKFAAENPAGESEFALLARASDKVHFTGSLS
ncbi:MAG TPA: MaoC/PaaZ C-terminal domain-containing protein [Nevskiaceae bacterium]|nr:MaoC/PaaZ C-terminal domain-containing protein [Nevskiaceae bacterium]